MAPFTQKRIMAHHKPGPGRPSEYRPEYDDLVVEQMAQGISLGAFAGVIRVGRETVYGWISRHPSFSDAVTRARSARQLFLEQKLLRARKGAETTAAVFALKNAAPADWQDLRNVAHKHDIEVRRLTDAQLLAIASGVSPGDSNVIDGQCVVIDQG